MKYIIDVEGEGIFPIQDTDRIMPFLDTARIHVYEEINGPSAEYLSDEALLSREAKELDAHFLGAKEIAYMDMDEDLVSEWEGVFYRFELELPEDTFSWQKLTVRYYSAEFWEWQRDMIYEMQYDDNILKSLPVGELLKIVHYYKFTEFYDTGDE